MKSKAIWRLLILAVLFVIVCVLVALYLFQSCVAESTPKPGETFVESKATPYTVYGVKAEPTPVPVQFIPPASHQPEEITEIPAPAPAGKLGTLIIGNKEIPIARNVEQSTLEKSPGWMPQSALPGESGMCVILGHRNRKHLRPLENVEIGDEIRFTYPDGRVATYSVSETMIYENTANWRLPAIDGDTLVLVTCYPFRYSGSAPGKYCVVCHRNYQSNP